MNKLWDFQRLSRTVDTDIIEAYPTYNWDWYYLTGKMSMDFILNNVHKPWNWEYVFRNKNLHIGSLKFLKSKNIYISETIMGNGHTTYDMVKFLFDEQKHKAATIIQRNCHNWLWKPKCKDGSVGLMVKKNFRNIEKETGGSGKRWLHNGNELSNFLEARSKK